MSDEIVKTLEDLIERISSGEVTSGAVRVFNVDGTSKDIVFGPSEEDRQAALATLQRELAARLH